MKYPIQIFSLGPKIIELHWPKIIAEDVLLEIIALKNKPARWIWTVPVCYAPEIVSSQNQYLQEKNMDLETLIEYHISKSFLLYFYGFLPGFMYLGGLPETLHIPRKTIPDRKISKGSVAIGGSQTGIITF